MRQDTLASEGLAAGAPEELRKDAQLAREFEVALPHELTAPQREWRRASNVQVRPIGRPVPRHLGNIG